MHFIGSFWSLLPAVVAIGLALLTKEVYSSLFVGIVIGGVFWALDSAAGFSGFVQHVFSDGIIKSASDAGHVGILVFLVVLGIMVALMNKAGGSAAFGKWAKNHIKTKTGAQLATVCLGILIFIDDYFNCLTVGSVMRPITDRNRVSREKLAFLIDATAAPVCIIAPISSWAAAVTGFVSDDGYALFMQAIPYNFYALFTFVMLFTLIGMKIDFGSMKKFEEAVKISEQSSDDEQIVGKGTVIDLVLPIVVLIFMCTLGMLYSGGFFTPMVADDTGALVANPEYLNFKVAFGDSDAAVGLVLGSFASLILTLILYIARGILPFKDCMSCVPDGFKAMVPAILILVFAWSLKEMTDSLNVQSFVSGVVRGSAASFMNFLPAIVFVIAAFIAFATGTSWGTFGILIPICIAVFPDAENPLRVISVSACMAGSVCGDHISPISDTTIMASAGAQCNFVNHVSSQLPYALCCAAVSFVTYIFAGFVKNAVLSFLFGAIVLLGTMYLVKRGAVKRASKV
ncbi:Na+/H+ antiporter NhaC family protein [Treponema zioleckii]|uniref:Na+/H+ antiporter NhaC family protein n=1 Tax=Treponema zioleckii TaxID=331680 RepID=UPI00168AD0F3|nr:Na+/H+ antiporter NhaC family protein [Treponema zioleckii]